MMGSAGEKKKTRKEDGEFQMEVGTFRLKGALDQRLEGKREQAM